MTSTGFPHSEILESKVDSTSSKLIAASHVLHRFLKPRHPPYTLSHLTKKKNQSINLAVEIFETYKGIRIRIAYS